MESGKAAAGSPLRRGEIAGRWSPCDWRTRNRARGSCHRGPHFPERVAGIAPKAIAKRLNHHGIAGPFGGTWSPSTIHGNSKRGTGILNNELHIGRLIWNRLRYVKNPDTGKRISRLNPSAEWITKGDSVLRIVSDELWNAAAKDRRA